jgi:hypothetical protein
LELRFKKDEGQWTMDNGQKTMDNGQWTRDKRLQDIKILRHQDECEIKVSPSRGGLRGRNTKIKFSR